MRLPCPQSPLSKGGKEERLATLDRHLLYGGREQDLRALAAGGIFSRSPPEARAGIGYSGLETLRIP